MKIILDVDTGIDDALAIMIAAVSDHVELLGITTVSGNVSLTHATDNTLNLLTKMSLSYDVFAGAEKPIAIKPYHAYDIHGENGMNGMLLESPINEHKGSALDFICESVDKYPNEVTIISTGPCTNLANLIIGYPDKIKQIKEVVLMTGAFFNPGNVTSHAEFNAFCDPHALNIVARSDLKTSFIGLDVTRNAKLYEDDLLKRNGEVYTFIHKLVEGYLTMFNKKFGERAILMHDPLALMAAIDPLLINFKKGNCSVVLEGEKRGLTTYEILGDNFIAESLNIEHFRKEVLKHLDRMEEFHVR